MKRFAAFCGSFLAVAILASVAQADTFFSGTISVDGAIAGGTPLAPANIVQGGGGIAYNNAWNAATGGISLPGNSYKQTAMGFFPVTAARVGNVNSSLNTGQRLVAVYAFEGVQSLIAGNVFAGDFDPSATVPAFSSFPTNPGDPPAARTGPAHAVVKIYNFGAVNPGLNDADPTTWIPGAGDFATRINDPANIVAELRIDHRADSYHMGPPGNTGLPGSTTLPLVINPAAVNTFPGDITGATLESRGDVKLVFNPDLLGTLGDFVNRLFNDPTAMSAFGDLTPPNFDPLVQADNPQAVQNQVASPTTGALHDAFDLFTNLDFLAFVTGAQPLLNAQNIADLNTLFDALLDSPFGGAIGNHSFSDQATPGNDLNTTQNFATGDITFRNQNGSGIPGAQFQVVIEPEPLSVLTWVVVGLVGVGYGWWRRCKSIATT